MSDREYCGLCREPLNLGDYRIHNHCIDELLISFEHPNPERKNILEPIKESIQQNKQVQLTCQICNILPAEYLNSETNIFYCSGCKRPYFQYIMDVLPEFDNLNQLVYCNHPTRICNHHKIRKKQRKIRNESNYKKCKLCNKRIERGSTYYIHDQAHTRADSWIYRYCSEGCYSKHFNH